MKTVALSIEGLRRAVQRLPNDALSAMRNAALENLEDNGLPTLKDEDWKYTDLSKAINISNRWFADAVATSTSHKNSLNDATRSIVQSTEANWLLIANGMVDTTRLEESCAIEVLRFSESAAPVIMDRPLADFNAALLNDGLRVTIHAATEKPLGILVIDESHSGAAVSQANVEIEVAPGCDAEIIEYQSSNGDGDHYGNSVITLKIGQSSQTHYVRIQDRHIGHVQSSRLSVTLGKNAKLDMASFDLGGSVVRNDVEIEIGEPGSEAIFNGLYLVGDGQHIDNHTRVDHRVGPASSSQEYRGILNGRCRGVWNGKAIVHKGADGTDANQSNHNLLLSQHAEIDTKPELEIYADDVKCSHGTTVGQLDDNALYYLRTRGLDKRTATELLVRAFATDIISRLPVKAALAAITSLLESRLAALVREETP